MSFISVFEVLGPNMIGPSSSHTAGAELIAYLAQKMFGRPIKKVVFTLYGSFAKTYHGHGTDYALLGGILGYSTDDVRIRESFDLAREAGIDFSFVEDHKTNDVHPNTVDIKMSSEDGHAMTIRGESIGGGKARIVQINGVKVNFSGDYCALIVVHKDEIGVVAHISNCLAKNNINIAFMNLFREAKGDTAYTIVESDEVVTPEAIEMIRQNPHVSDVMLVQL